MKRRKLGIGFAVADVVNKNSNTGNSISWESELHSNELKMPRKLIKADLLVSKFEDCKLKVKFPRLLKYEDVNATNVDIYNSLKGNPHIVLVPEYWNSRNKYLCSLNCDKQRTFSIPEIIEKSEISRYWKLFESRNQTLADKLKARRYPKIDKIKSSVVEATNKILRQELKINVLKYGDLLNENWYTRRIYAAMTPGDLSLDLREALSMAENGPVPWLYAMQDYGLPPEYPELRIRGINCPIPKGAKWGNEKGNWGTYNSLCDENVDNEESGEFFTIYDDEFSKEIYIELDTIFEDAVDNKMVFNVTTGKFS